MTDESTPGVDVLKKQYDKDLRHIKAIMVSKKKTMTNETWLRYVQKTRNSILENPSDFLSIVADPKTLKLAIHKVFEGFMEDQKIREAQKSVNKWRYEL